MRSRVLSASVITALAGAAVRQPAVDGTLAGDEACYGDVLDVQNVGTGFGDNHPDNVPPSGDASTAFSGIELCIPLAALGNVTGNGDIRLAGFVVSADFSYTSNQTIGGLPNLGNLGNPVIDFGAISGDQWITITAETGGSPPFIDGFLDGDYGDPQDDWLQNNYTGFGDATHGNFDGGSGSEIDVVYAWTDGVTLYLLIAGNLEANANGMALFFDVIAGGQNALRSDNPVIDNPIDPSRTDVLNAMGGNIFDPGFEPDVALLIAGNDTTGNGDFALAAHYAVLLTGGGGAEFFLGTGAYASDGTLTGADPGAPAVLLTIDNENIEGVTGSPSITIPSRDFAVGSEIDNTRAYVEQSTGVLHVLIAGNLESNYNKLDIFIDCVAGGQNRLRGDNADVDFNGLNRMGDDGTGNGLTFDAGFEADAWISYTNGIGGSGEVEHYLNAAQLLSGGGGPGGFVAGGKKSDFMPITGTGPLGMAISADGDNSNIAGVTGSSAAGAELVTTGFEFAIDLNPLGYSGGPVKLAAFINGGGHDFVSNQTIGGLDSGANLGEPRAVDFNADARTQHVDVPVEDRCAPACPDPDQCGDWDNSGGQSDGTDFFAFLDSFAGGDDCADLALPDGLGGEDFFAYLDRFVIACP